LVVKLGNEERKELFHMPRDVARFSGCSPIPIFERHDNTEFLAVLPDRLGFTLWPAGRPVAFSSRV
jgi:hypothetical protein